MSVPTVASKSPVDTTGEAEPLAMKALAIRQPYAWLVVHGIKDVENRSWPTCYRGPFFVHASKAIDQEDVRFVREKLAPRGITLPEELPRGGIVGIVTLDDCVQYIDIPWWRRLLCRVVGNDRIARYRQPTASDWFEGPYGFVLRDARPLPFIPWRGQQSFFNVPDDLYPPGLLAGYRPSPTGNANP
jgi:hypothetical protein